jgi:hypothetical protein
VGRVVVGAALTALLTPAFLFFYHHEDAAGNNLLFFTAVGFFYVITFANFTNWQGHSYEGFAFRIFDPNWYLDVGKYLGDASYTTPTSDSSLMTFNAEKLCDQAIAWVYGNGTTDSTLGIAGVLMAAYLVLLLAGIGVDIANQPRIAGIVLLIGTLAGLAAMLLVYLDFTSTSGGFEFWLAWSPLTAAEFPYDKLIPIPIGIIPAALAGIRAIMTKPRPKPESYNF